MGYGILTKLTSGGQSVKIKTTGGYLELETNHRLVMCNYPIYLIKFDFHYKKINK